MMKPMTVADAGRMGGRARANKLSAHRRKEIARLGYEASPLSKLSTCLKNKRGHVHEFPWPIDLITRDEYKALDESSKKKQAIRLVRIAMSRLGLRAPKQCSNCDLPGYKRVSGHHDDYSQPMRVRFICHACHISLHRLSDKQQLKGQSSGNGKHKSK